ncbi:phosphodiesterase [Lacrimispora sp.]|uniref:phosphodiesterase n=1 Tax=Lacrimispora sp. TaxID=2719234 RepID=UPI0028A81654|nr:phosphodiesterase [Lacrimispora sp.]
MKYMIASDIHGSAYYCGLLLDEYRKSGASRLILLGDILYHGPRNDLPRDYDPKAVITMLNGIKDQIYSVRGNCDTEVDQMVLEFPVLADYGLLVVNGLTIYLTHGHIYHKDHLPPVQKGDILLHGHTHILTAEREGDITILNPGSVSIPKGGNPPTYGILEEQVFRILDFEGNVQKEIDLGE